MAKRSSRKSSSGDEALLWGIAAVVVAVAGVGTAIMLTRRGKPGSEEMHTCTAGTIDTNATMFKCSGGTQGCVNDSPIYCNPVKSPGKSCIDQNAPRCNPGTKKTKDGSKKYTDNKDHQTNCCEPTTKPMPPGPPGPPKPGPAKPAANMVCLPTSKPECQDATATCSEATDENACSSFGCCVWTDPYCYRALRQGTGKDIKYFVQKKNNKIKDGTCPQGWVLQPEAGLKGGTYTTIEENSTNQCYNNYLLPTDYTNSTCLQAGDCDDKNKCPPPCKVQSGNGRCLSKVNSQNKRNCVGGDQLCGVNLAAHTKAHKEDKTCDDLLQYADKMIECSPGYTAYVEPNQGNCVFKCGDDSLGECCATSTNTYSKDPTNPPEQQCKMAGPNKTTCGELDPNCTWTIPTATQPTQTTKFGCIV
jgi:hypothetical protein